MTPEFMTMERCDEKHRETMSVLNAINDRLYKDNGKKSIQTRLNEHSDFIRSQQKIQNWLCGVVGSAIVLGLLTAAFDVFMRVHGAK